MPGTAMRTSVRPGPEASANKHERGADMDHRRPMSAPRSAAGDGVERQPQPLRADRIGVEVVRVVAGRAADRAAVPQAGPGEAVAPEDPGHLPAELAPAGR